MTPRPFRASTRWAPALAAALALLLTGCESGQVAAPVGTGVQWTRLTDPNTVNQPYFPDWRGSRILLSYATTDGYRRLATMNDDGTNVTFLSAGSTERVSPGRWVDDSTIVYASNAGSAGGFNLWTRVLTTDQIRQITSGAQDEFDPAPRPGTTGLVYTDGSEFAGRVALIPDYFNVATPEVLYLTPPTMRAGQVDWDPSGTRICFTADSTGGSRHVWMITLAPGDSTPVQLTFGPYVDSCPRFSPDGTRILFASDKRTGRPGVWTIPPEGQAAGLTAVAFDDLGAVTDTPCWSPDGTEVVVSSRGKGFGRCLWLLSNLR